DGQLNDRCGSRWRRDDRFEATRNGRSLNEVDGPGGSRHVQVPDLELRLREVVHDSADTHVLRARSEVAQGIEANDRVDVLLAGGRCRRHAVRLLAVVELEDLPTEGHARLGTKLIELIEVPLPHKGDRDAGLPARPVRPTRWVKTSAYSGRSEVTTWLMS